MYLYDVINRFDWSFRSNFVDPNMAVAALNDKLDTIFENNVPRKKPTSKSYPLWFNDHIYDKNKRQGFKKYIKKLAT